MNDFFCNTSEHKSHIYIADYTQQTNSERGVEISDIEFDDIQYCQFENNRNIICHGVNFEKNKKAFTAGGKLVEQCECMIASQKANKKRWLCLVELKYCKDKNIEENAKTAYSQLESTYNYLVESGIIDLNKHRVYFNISIPDHTHKEPFHGFVLSQEDILDIKKRKKIHILGYNTVGILNESYLEFNIS